MSSPLLRTLRRPCFGTPGHRTPMPGESQIERLKLSVGLPVQNMPGTVGTVGVSMFTYTGRRLRRSSKYTKINNDWNLNTRETCYTLTAGRAMPAAISAAECSSDTLAEDKKILNRSTLRSAMLSLTDINFFRSVFLLPRMVCQSGASKESQNKGRERNHTHTWVKGKRPHVMRHGM